MSCAASKRRKIDSAGLCLPVIRLGWTLVWMALRSARYLRNLASALTVLAEVPLPCVAWQRLATRSAAAAPLPSERPCQLACRAFCSTGGESLLTQVSSGR